MKNAVFVATAVVAAVLLVQGAGSSVAPLSSHAGQVTIASSVTAAQSDSGSSNLPTVKTVTAAATGATTSTSTTTTSSSSTASSAASSTSSSAAASTSYSSASTSTSTQSFTSAPATYTAPAPVQTPTPTPTPTCPSAIGGSTAGAPGASDPSGVPGTTSADINSFAAEYNAIRVSNCLAPIPLSNVRYSTCLQARLWWMADDPSTDPLSAWGHTGTAVRSDGVPIVGCDGDLAGGTGYTGASVADAWWASLDHRASLYQPSFTGNVAGVCIAFAMSHGGINVPAPNEPYSFTRSAAYWYSC